MHSLIARNNKREITEESLRSLVAVLNHLFVDVPALDEEESLPPIPANILESLDRYNKSMYSIYHGFMNTTANLFFKPHYRSVLPLSGLEHDCPDTGCVDPLAEQAGVSSIRNEEVDTLAPNLRRDLLTESLPRIRKLPTNGFALEFFKSGENIRY